MVSLCVLIFQIIFNLIKNTVGPKYNFLMKMAKICISNIGNVEYEVRLVYNLHNIAKERNSP